MELVDFTHFKKRNKAYAGANGNKISILYEGEQYMLKFPSHAKLNKDMSYSNSCFSEYLGCRIFDSVGIPVQKVILGTYTIKGVQKIVVACGDFTRPGITLQDFASLKNQMIDSERNGYGTELSDIIQAIETQTSVDSAALLSRFWDMFIIDAFIGNWDRHNGNWGFLYEDISDTVSIAPVYDCGSSLYPQADESIMENVLQHEGELNHRIYNIPTSAITIDHKNIRYFDFISSLQNEECNRALERILPCIEMNKIKEMIEDIPVLSDLQKQFYSTMLTERKAKILDFSYMKLKNSQNMNPLQNKQVQPGSIIH